MKQFLLIVPLSCALLASGQQVPAQWRSLHPNEYRFKIHAELPEYLFRLLRDHDDMVDKIEVRVAGRSDPVQVLQVPDDTDVPAPNVPLFEAADVDCDGYLDIKLVHWWGATGNTAHFFWLYDKKTRRFVFDDQFSELSNVTADCRKNQIFSHSTSGDAGQSFTQKTLQYEGSKLVIVQQVEQTWNTQSNCFSRTTFRRMEGKLEKVDTKCVPKE